MSKFCTRCGAENTDDAIFCKTCGAPLEPATQAAPSPQQYTPPGYGQPMYQPGPDTMLYSNLQNLRSAFFWMFLGLILTIIPIVNIAGAIILLIAYILLIIGFEKVAKTILPHADEYRSTKNWLLISLILSFVFVIFIVSTFVVTSAVTSGPGSTVTSSNALSKIGIVIIVLIAVLAVAMFVTYIITYLKLVNSFKSLGSDLSVHRLNTAGTYLFYALIISIVGYILLPLFFYFHVFILSITVPLSSISSVVATLAVPSIVIIVAYILEIVSFYNAYTGIDEFLKRPRAIPPSSMQQNTPPQQPEPPKFSF